MPLTSNGASAPRDGGRARDRLGDAQLRRRRRDPADDVVAHHVALEREADAGGDVRGVDDPAHVGPELGQPLAMEPPVVEGVREQVCSRLRADDLPRAEQELLLERRRRIRSTRGRTTCASKAAGSPGVAHRRVAVGEDPGGDGAAETRTRRECGRATRVGEEAEHADCGEGRTEAAARKRHRERRLLRHRRRLGTDGGLARRTAEWSRSSMPACLQRVVTHVTTLRLNCPPCNRRRRLDHVAAVS